MKFYFKKSLMKSTLLICSIFLCNLNLVLANMTPENAPGPNDLENEFSYGNNEDGDNYLEEPVKDYQFSSFKDEMNFLENRSKNLNNYLNNSNEANNINSANNENSDNSFNTDKTLTDEVSITHSAINRSPAVLPKEYTDSELDQLMNANKEVSKKRRVRSR